MNNNFISIDVNVSKIKYYQKTTKSELNINKFLDTDTLMVITFLFSFTFFISIFILYLKSMNYELVCLKLLCSWYSKRQAMRIQKLHDVFKTFIHNFHYAIFVCILKILHNMFNRKMKNVCAYQHVVFPIILIKL